MVPTFPDTKISNHDDSVNEENFFLLLHLPAKLHIVRYLNIYDRVNLMMVSKHFRELIMKSWISMKHLYFSNVGEIRMKNQSKLERMLALCGQYISSIEIQRATGENLILVNKYCQNLRSVTLSEECGSDEFQQWEFELCLLLEKNSKIDCLNLTLINVAKLCYLCISKLETLKSLQLSVCKPFYSNISHYLDCLQNLTKLQIFKLFATFIDVKTWLSSTFVKLQNLTDVKINGVRFEHASVEYFENIIMKNKNLRNFSVRLTNFNRNLNSSYQHGCGKTISYVYGCKKNKNFVKSVYYSF